MREFAILKAIILPPFSRGFPARSYLSVCRSPHPLRHQCKPRKKAKSIKPRPIRFPWADNLRPYRISAAPLASQKKNLRCRTLAISQSGKSPPKMVPFNLRVLSLIRWCRKMITEGRKGAGGAWMNLTTGVAKYTKTYPESYIPNELTTSRIIYQIDIYF